MHLQGDEFFVGERPQVGCGNGLGIAGCNAIDTATVREIDGIAAHVRIMPVQNIDAPFRTNLDAESDPGQIIGRHEIIPMLTDKATSIWDQDVGQNGVFVDITHKQTIAILLWKSVCQVNSGTPMR